MAVQARFDLSSVPDNILQRCQDGTSDWSLTSQFHSNLSCPGGWPFFITLTLSPLLFFFRFYSQWFLCKGVASAPPIGTSWHMEVCKRWFTHHKSNPYGTKQTLGSFGTNLRPTSSTEAYRESSKRSALDQLRKPKIKGQLYVWLSRCNRVTCSVMFPSALHASLPPMWDADVVREIHIHVVKQINKSRNRCCTNDKLLSLLHLSTIVSF